MAIVEAIRYVDKVVPQENMDKMAAWEKYRFDAMFVGDDWQGTDKWNEYERQFSQVGVDIVYFPYTQGTSSTKLRWVLDKIIGQSNIVISG
jgi:glycerol-3-phosphate cytidylyltransferase